MIDISASSEVIEQIISEEKKDIENASRAESIKKVQQFISDKQETSLDGGFDKKISAVNKRYSNMRVIILLALIVTFAVDILVQHNLIYTGLRGLVYEVGCVVVLFVCYVLFMSKDRKQIKDAYEKTNKAVSFEMIDRADEVLRALVEGKAYTIKDAEAVVSSVKKK